MPKPAPRRGADDWKAPVRFLPRALLEPRRPERALVVGWLTAFLPSIALGAAVSGLLPELGQPELPIAGARAFLLVVIFAPMLETLIMAAALAVLLRLLPPTVAVLASSIGWGLAHSAAAPAWGLVIWWPFLVFSTIYATWRNRSVLAALAMAAATHALHNSVPALLLLFDVRA